LAPETYQHSLWFSFYRFSSVRLKNNSVKFWQLFLGLGTTGARKVENQARVTRFCTQNIPTLFGTHFLSFPISTAEKCFDRTLTTLSSPGTTGACKVENWAQMTRFWHPKHTHPIWDAFLVVSHSYVWIWSRRNFHDFFGLGHYRSTKRWKKGQITRFSAPNIPHFLGCNSYRFQLVWQKNVSIEFWRLFRARHHWRS